MLVSETQAQALDLILKDQPWTWLPNMLRSRATGRVEHTTQSTSQAVNDTAIAFEN
jgi:hypothetical protein